MKIVTIRDWLTSVRKLSQVSHRALYDAWKDNESLFTRAVILSIATAIMPYSIQWFYSRAIGAIANPLVRTTALWYITGALLASLLIDITSVWKLLTERQFYHRMEVKFNVIFFSKKGSLGIDSLENPNFRDVITKAQENLIIPIINVANGQFVNLNNLVKLAFVIAIVGIYDWRLCLIVIVALVPQFFVDIRHGATLWRIFDAEIDTRRQYFELRKHFINRSFLSELKLFQNVDFFMKRIWNILENFRKTQESAEKIRCLYSAFAIIISASLIGTVMIIITSRAINGVISVATFVFLWSSMQSLHTTLSVALRSISQQNQWAIGAADNYAVIDAEPEKARRTGTILCSERIPEIEFDNVTFHYPWENLDRLKLRNISFKIKPGERMALVGINGAGKTTLAKLLCGIYEPSSGRILIDGVDIRHLDHKSWGRQLAVLSQEYAIYHMPVSESIALGNTAMPVDEQLVNEASLASRADAFIADLPQGYSTMIGKDFAGGFDLSGGQNQRIALARLFYRKGKVIILDEPTASLDAFAEAQIFEELETRARNESMMLITHRFSAVKNVDHIVVLDQGMIVEEGNHASLMKLNGLYAEMFLKQAKGYMTGPMIRIEE